MDLVPLTAYSTFTFYLLQGLHRAPYPVSYTSHRAFPRRDGEDELTWVTGGHIPRSFTQVLTRHSRSTLQGDLGLSSEG